MSDREKNIELRSDEIQDIMGKVPPWLIRSGITGLSIIIILLISIAAWFKYPDRIVSPIQLTTDNPPVSMVARTTAKITEFFAEEDKQVEAGDLLVVLESGADYQQVLETRDSLKDFYANRDEPDTAKLKQIAYLKGLELGNLQGPFAEFQKSVLELLDFLRFDKYQMQIDGKEAEARNLRIHNNRLWVVRQNKEKEVDIANTQLKRNQELHVDATISDVQLEESNRTYLNQKNQFEEARLALSSNEILQGQLEQDIVRLKIQKNEDELSTFAQVDESKDKFLGALSDWEQKYLLISPTSGKVSLGKFWSVNREVKQDTRILTIVQESTGPILGKVILPSLGSGKVKKGQEVIIRFDRYNYMEFGLVTGVINYISPVPEEANYFVEVGFPNGLNTSYDQELLFTQEMTGQAEIITEVRSFLLRVFTPLKSMMKRNSMSDS